MRRMPSMSMASIKPGARDGPERIASLDAGVQQFVALLVHAQEDGAKLGFVTTRATLLALTRAMSAPASGSITSTSPESKAATRVASLPIGVKITSVALLLDPALRSCHFTKVVRIAIDAHARGVRPGAIGANDAAFSMPCVDRPVAWLVGLALPAHPVDLRDHVGQDGNGVLRRFRRHGHPACAHLLDVVGEAAHVRSPGRGVRAGS